MARYRNVAAQHSATRMQSARLAARWISSLSCFATSSPAPETLIRARALLQRPFQIHAIALRRLVYLCQTLHSQPVRVDVCSATLGGSAGPGGK
jgi:hypothetical protein